MINWKEKGRRCSKHSEWSGTNQVHRSIEREKEFREQLKNERKGAASGCISVETVCKMRSWLKWKTFLFSAIFHHEGVVEFFIKSATQSAVTKTFISACRRANRQQTSQLHSHESFALEMLQCLFYNIKHTQNCCNNFFCCLSCSFPTPHTVAVQFLAMERLPQSRKHLARVFI